MASSESLTDRNRGPGEVALIVVLTVISTLIVMLRVYSKLFVLRGIGWDDATMAVAVIFSIVYEAANIVNIKYGYGRHRIFLNDYQASHSSKWGFMSGILYNLTIFFVKFSIILFLLRIGKLKRWVRVVIYLDLFLVFGSLATTIIVQLVQCIPITHNWNPAVSAHCLPSRTLTLVSYISSAFTAMTDFVCAILPFFILWDLKISRQSKISVWILLCFGMFPGACSVVKIFYLKTLGTSDSTWTAIPLTTWGVAEIHSGIVAGSIPALRALFLRAITKLRGDPKLRGSSYESRNPYRHKGKKHAEDDDRASVYPLHERSDAGNQGGIVKTTEFEVTNTSNKGDEESRPEAGAEGGGHFGSSTPDGSGLFVNSASARV